MAEPQAAVTAETCPECGELIEPAGRQSPKMALGLHRKKAHGVQGAHAASNRRAAREPESVTAGAFGALSDAGSSAGAGSKSTKPPTSDQLAKFLGRLFGYAAYGVVTKAVTDDQRLETIEQHDALVNRLTPEPAAAVSIMRPPARLAARSKLNTRYGRTLIDNSDLIDSAVNLMDWLGELRRYRFERLRWERENGIRPVVDTTAREGPAARPAPPGPPPGPPPGYDPGRMQYESQGIVVTPDMIHANGSGPRRVANAEP